MLITDNTPVTRSHSRHNCRIIRCQHCCSRHKSNLCTLCCTTITPLCLFITSIDLRVQVMLPAPGRHFSHTTSCSTLPSPLRTSKAEMLCVYRGIGISYILWSREELLARPYLLHNMKAWEDTLLVSQGESSKGRFSNSRSNADLLTRKINTITITWW